jgi:hypothetical protein
MSNDSKASGEPKRALRGDSGAQMQAQVDSSTAVDGLLDSLGYEAADPTLQSPFWSEALQSGGAAKSPR